jgi:hypothetical protein
MNFQKNWKYHETIILDKNKPDEFISYNVIGGVKETAIRLKWNLLILNGDLRKDIEKVTSIQEVIHIFKYSMYSISLWSTTRNIEDLI